MGAGLFAIVTDGVPRSLICCYMMMTAVCDMAVFLTGIIKNLYCRSCD